MSHFPSKNAFFDIKLRVVCCFNIKVFTIFACFTHPNGKASQTTTLLNAKI